MGLLDLAAQTDELWKTVVKKDGTEMPWMKKCTDIARLDKEEPEVSKAVSDAVNKWLEEDPNNAAKLKDFSQGFKMTHTDGNVYRVTQRKEGGMEITRWKQKGSGGSGGYSKGSSYIHMRPDTVLMVHFEELKSLIDNQEDNDNFRITFLNQVDAKAGPLFLVENVRPYTPKAVSSTESTTKQESSEETSEEGQ